MTRGSDAAVDRFSTLGLTTVAEGVETAATAALTGYGCDVAQGHYYSPPMTAPELLHLLTPAIRTPGPLREQVPFAGP
jgi:EAL domain-containing protein (putative c-di-GMP-specific phosphodiesterase class I)